MGERPSISTAQPISRRRRAISRQLIVVAVATLVTASCGRFQGDEADSSTGPTVPEGMEITSTTTPPVGQMPEPEFLGNPFSGDALANIDVGGKDLTTVSYRFRAEKPGRIAAVRPFLVANTSRTGYAAGTGGTVQLTLVPDDGNGLPDLTQKFAVGQIELSLVDGGLPDPAGAEEKKAQNYPLIELTDNFVTAGNHYHIVFEQTDPDPVANYIGLDLMYQYNTELGPRPPIEDWGVTIHTPNEDWKEYTFREGDELYSPIMSITMDDGTTYGNGYIEAFPDEGIRPLNSDDSVQVTFQPDDLFNASQWWIRARRDSNQGFLTARLQISDGTEDTVNISTEEFEEDEMRWVSVPWRRSFDPDLEYTLTLEGTEGGSFMIHPLRQGSDYDYEPGSFFNGISRPSGPDGYVGWHKEQSDPVFTNADIMSAWTR